MEFSDIKKRLMALDASQLCDASPNVKVVDGAIKPINLGLKMVGIAHTVSSGGDVMPVLHALLNSKPDEVLVINTNNTHKAVVGEIFSTEAKKRKIAGIVIDGACRDTAYVRKVGLPVYAKYINPQVGTKRKVGETQVPVEIGHVSIYPGDIIFGDDDGIVVIKPEDILPTLQKAEEICALEARIIKQVKGGTDLAKLMNFDEYYGELKRGITTGMLRFKKD